MTDDWRQFDAFWDFLLDGDPATMTPGERRERQRVLREESSLTADEAEFLDSLEGTRVQLRWNCAMMEEGLQYSEGTMFVVERRFGRKLGLRASTPKQVKFYLLVDPKWVKPL